MRVTLCSLKWAVVLSVLYTTPFLLGCKKTVTVKDIKTDTIYNIDTTILRDTVYDLTDSLVAYYNFNNGNLKDSSGWHNDIVFNSATPTTDRFGKPGNAYLFDGSTSYMRVTGAFSLTPKNLTLMAIVKFNGFSNGIGYGNSIVTKGDFENQPSNFYLRAYPLDTIPTVNTASETFMGYNGDGFTPRIVDSSVLIHTGQWYIIVFTFDPNNKNLYVDGHLVATMGCGTSIISAEDLYIGKSLSIGLGLNGENWFNGVIDEIRIYGKVLRPVEIQQFNKLTE